MDDIHGEDASFGSDNGNLGDERRTDTGVELGDIDEGHGSGHRSVELIAGGLQVVALNLALLGIIGHDDVDAASGERSLGGVGKAGEHCSASALCGLVVVGVHSARGGDGRVFRGEDVESASLEIVDRFAGAFGLLDFVGRNTGEASHAADLFKSSDFSASEFSGSGFDLLFGHLRLDCANSGGFDDFGGARHGHRRSLGIGGTVVFFGFVHGDVSCEFQGALAKNGFSGVFSHGCGIVGRNCDNGNFERLPIRDAIGIHSALGVGGFQHQAVDAIADGDFRADAVLDVLKDFLGLFGPRKANGSNSLPPRNGSGLNYTDLIARIMLKKERRRIVEAIKSNGIRAVIENLAAKVSFDLVRFGRENNVNRPRFLIN